VGALLGLAGPVGAGEKQDVEITAIYLAAPALGEPRETPSGNIHFRGVIATPIMMLANNPLLTGRLTWVGDFNLDADWMGVGAGTGILEVGTWNGLEFTPSGGVWVTKWEGKGDMRTAYEIKVMAHGVLGKSRVWWLTWRSQVVEARITTADGFWIRMRKSRPG
jgi:hypothetical protein